MKLETKESLSIFDKFYFAFFLILPFIYNNKLIDPALVSRQLYLSSFLLILILIFFFRFYGKRQVIDTSFLKTPFFTVQFLFLVIVLVSFSQATLVSESMYVFSKLGVEVVFLGITTYLLIQNQLSLSFLIKTVTLFCLIIFFNASYQAISFSKYSSDFFDNMISVRSTFGHKNLLASILFLTLPFLLLATYTLKKGWKRLAIFLIVGVFVFVWLLQAKAVLVSCFIFFACIIFILSIRKRNLTEKILTKKVLAVTLFLILGIATVTFCNREKFPRLFDKKSSFERLELWRNSKAMVGEHVFLGVGAGNWQINFPKYGLNNFGDNKVRQGITTFQRPHNDFIWILCETGLFGLIAYLSIFGCIVYYLIKLIGNGSNDFLYASLFAVVISYLCIAFVDFPLERIEHQVILMLIFSIVIAHYIKQFAENKQKKSNILSPIYVGGILTLFSIMIGVYRYKGEYHTQRLYTFERTDNWNSMQQEAKMAISPFYKIDPTSAPIEWYRGVALFSKGDLDSAGACFEIAYRQHPYNIHVLNNLASYYEKKEDHNKAEQFYQKALGISSEFEEARLNLSAVYYNTRKYEKAFETIDLCNIHSTDQKYQLFLPAILSALVNDRKEKNARLKERNIDKTELVQWYQASKRENISFKNYIENLK